jgi:site-specific recombinase XerD
LHPRAFACLEAQGKTGGLSNQFADVLFQAGLRPRAARRSGEKGAAALSFNSLRHTTVTVLHEQGVPPSVVQGFVGHDSAAVDAQYTHIGQEALRKAASSLPDVT